MNIITFIITVTIIWSVVLFIILPIGVKIPDKVEIGHADSAPENPQIGLKTLISFIISVVLTLVFWYLLVHYPQLEKIIK